VDAASTTSGGRSAWWLAALSLTSLALAATTVFTYRNAESFVRERLVRSAVLYAQALEVGARQLGPFDADEMEELLVDSTGPEVRGLALVGRDGDLVAFAGLLPAGDFATAAWVARAARHRTVDTGPEVEGTLPVAVPTLLGCRARGPGPPPRGHRPRGRGRGPGRCLDPDMALVLAMDVAQADDPVRDAQLQAAFVGAALVLAWLLAWRWFRVVERARRLEAEARRRETFAALGEMAAVLAHEIRNPLGAIRGHAQLAQKRLEDDPKAARSLETVVGETARLSRLVDGLLRYARPRPPKREPTAVGALVDRVVGLMADRGGESDVAVAREGEGAGPTIAGDAEQLEQVLINLVLNAIEAQPEGGRVRLRAGTDGSEAVVEVDDSGPGIAEDARDSVFRPFVTTRAEGTGLGLAIARQIAEAHGGSLSLRPSALGGASFELRLPIGQTTP
jgi:signal transduction histidine kinase